MNFLNVAIVFLGFSSGIFFQLAEAQSLSARQAPWVGYQFNDAACTGSEHGVGPLDYTSAADRALKVFGKVERAHFTMRVETLGGGTSSSNENAYGDLSYTLVSIPNHHRALYTMIRLQSNSETKKRIIMRGGVAVECFLQRAKYFSPKDPIVPMLYGILLHKESKYEMALDEYELALELGAINAELHYNMGLLLLKMNRTDEALEQARLAYKMKYPLMGLQKKLVAKGVWIEDSGLQSEALNKGTSP